MLRDVEIYASTYGLDDVVPLLKKGALVAQKPGNFETIQDLNEEDVSVLQVEKDHRWKHPWVLYYTIILNSIAAAVQGWDQTGKRSSSTTSFIILTADLTLL